MHDYQVSLQVLNGRGPQQSLQFSFVVELAFLGSYATSLSAAAIRPWQHSYRTLIARPRRAPHHARYSRDQPPKS